MISPSNKLLLRMALLQCLAPAISFAQLPGLLSQTALLPADFRESFFEAPLAARVQINGKNLGDAMIMLSRDNTVRLLEFTDVSSAVEDGQTRQKWAQLLSKPHFLGACSNDCENGLTAIDYSLETALLSLFTSEAEQNTKAVRYHALPEHGSYGLTLQNQLNISGGDQQDSAGSWRGDLRGSTGHWTSVSSFQVDRSGDRNAPTRHSLNNLYLERELPGTFLRTGLFTPDSQGVLRRPYTPGQSSSSVGGVMLGSSDALIKQGASPSLYPVYVTANRQGIIEIYRDGVMINSQPVESGLQPIDTSVLPGGIYSVEIRVLEEGKVVSRSEETIYKPQNWANPQQKMRYNVYAGQSQNLWDNSEFRQDNGTVVGGNANYLLHPRLTGGLALELSNNDKQAGVSADWRAADRFNFFANSWHSSRTGNGFDLQAAMNYSAGSVMLNHGRSWRYIQNHNASGSSSCCTIQSEQTSGVSLNHRLSNSSSINSRVTHSSVNKGIGVDIGFSTRHTFLNTDISWRLSGFDRPYRDNDDLRNRGISVNASFALGGRDRSASVSMGSRTDSRGSRDYFASASLHDDWEDGFIRQSSNTVTADRYGVGLNSYNQFTSQPASGSMYLQSSSENNKLSGGLNLNSTVAVGNGTAAVSGITQSAGGSGVIVDVESDDPTVKLMAYHPGGSSELKAGRNFVPVKALRAETLSFDFPGNSAPALKIWPESFNYHLNRGGVSHHKVRVMQTVTVMGRLIDTKGQPVAGAFIINHAGRTVSENDGFFTLDLHEHTPVIAIEHNGIKQCEIRLEPKAHRRDGQTLLAGNLQCPAV